MFLHPELGSDPPIRLGRESGLTPRARPCAPFRAPARHSARPRSASQPRAPACLRLRAQRLCVQCLRACAPLRLLSAFAPRFLLFPATGKYKNFIPIFFSHFFFSYPSVAFLATSTCNSLNTASIQLNNFMSLTLKFIKILFHYPITQIILL